MFWVCFSAVTIFFLASIYFSPHLIRRIQERRLRSLCQKKGILVLTYDDGPSHVTTMRLLDVLAEYGVKATFFLLGRRVQAAPDVVSRLKTEGHELASHSQEHLNAWRVTPWRSLWDTQHGFVTLAACGADFRLYRPPYGKLNAITHIATKCYGLRCAWWTVVSGDTFDELPDPASIVNRVENEGGGVVLMHDFDRGEERLTYVVELTRRLLDTARLRGWRVCTESELMQVNFPSQRESSVSQVG